MTDQLTTIFRDTFDLPDLEIDGLSRATFPEWDSLAQVKLILAVEEEFGIKFTIDQVANMSSVAELRAELTSRGAV